MNVQQPDPLVTVLTTTYNLAGFVERTLDSALSQQTNFRFEILVADDASKDGTPAILKRYAERWPDQVRLILRSENLGLIRNIASAVAECRGKYLAFLDGDDYWTDTQKLQKQVDALEENQDCNIAACYVNYVNPDASVIFNFPPEVTPGRKPFSELLLENFICTSSLLYRIKPITIPDWYYSLKISDWPLHLLYGDGKDTIMLPETMANYQIHPNNNWWSRPRSAHYLDELQFHEHAYSIVERRFHKYVDRARLKLYQGLAVEYCKSGERKKAARYAWEQLVARPYLYGWNRKMVTLLTVFSPGGLSLLVSLKRLVRSALR